MNFEELIPKEKKVLIVNKKINAIWHYFCVFYFWISIVVICAVLFLFIKYILPIFPEIKEWTGLIVNYLKDNNESIRGVLNG